MQNSPPKKEKMTIFQVGLRTPLDPPGTPPDPPGTYPEPSDPPQPPPGDPQGPQTMTGYM